MKTLKTKALLPSLLFFLLTYLAKDAPFSVPQDTNPPRILSVNPSESATNVELNTWIWTDFSKPMDGSSFNYNTITVVGSTSGTLTDLYIYYNPDMKRVWIKSFELYY